MSDSERVRVVPAIFVDMLRQDARLEYEYQQLREFGQLVVRTELTDKWYPDTEEQPNGRKD